MYIGDVVFMCYNERVDLQQRILRKVVDIIKPIRAAFMAGYQQYKQRYIQKVSKLSSYKPKYDLEDNKMLDFSYMGVGTNSLGYGHNEVDEAVKKCIQKGNM